jgi:hypothetical protein
MSSTYLARSVLNTRLTALETARQDVENQISFFNEKLGEQYGRSHRIDDEEISIHEALRQLEVLEPTPEATEDFDDIPF